MSTKTKEQIQDYVWRQHDADEYFTTEMIDECMDEHAKQIAISFARFCGSYGDKGPDGAWSENYWSGNAMAGEPALTTEQLYEKFIKK